MSISYHQFGGVYPTAGQQSARMGTALSSSIHSAGMANKAPSLPYTRSSSGALKPTGSPYGQRWGELTRQNKPGRDIWGGKEISGLKYGGGPAQHSDYWHQMTEQTMKSPIKSASTPKLPKAGGPLTTITGQGSVPGGGSGGWAFGKQMR